MKKYHNYEFNKAKKEMLIFFSWTIFTNLMTLLLFLMILDGITFNYPIPAQSEAFCNRSNSVYVMAMEWVVFVPGVKYKLWVFGIAYFTIHIKQSDDIFQGISKLDHLLKISIF